jgi:hypothetical protein
MNTDRLIEMLSTNVEPVKTGQLKKTLALTLVAGGLAAFCVMLSTVGLRSYGGGHYGFLFLKLGFMLTLIGAGTALLSRLIRPGQDGRRLYMVIFVVFAVIGLSGAVALALRPAGTWGHMVMGTQWAMCAFCIPLFAIVPFAALIWALRRGAPTNLRRAGAIAGLVAGAVGAVAYAFHCPDDSIPFIALWYGAMVALCALLGSMLGPRLLRW